MYCVRGGWAGQTFALASQNVSDGRKTRNRRSKEERKTLVETFIKKYQSLNDGNFPSLNLTQQEVGGSFYTIREIVREVIQENKVLGPAKYSPEQQKIDSISVDHGLVAISSDTENSLGHATDEPLVDSPSSSAWDLPSEGHMQLSIGLGLENGQFVGGDHGKELDETVYGEEQINDGSMEYHNGSISVVSQSNLDHLVDSMDVASSPVSNSSSEISVIGDIQGSIATVMETGQFVDSNQNGDLCESISRVSTESRSSETDKGSKLMWESTGDLTNPTAAVDVETFPIRPVSSDGPLHQTKDLSGPDYGLGTKRAVSGSDHNVLNSLDSINSLSSLVNQGARDSANVPLLVGTPCRADGQSVADLLSESPELSVPQIDISTKTIQPPQDSAAKEPKGFLVNGAYVKNPNKLINETMSMESLSRKVVLGSRDDGEKGTFPTLDRINLESWEGASKKPETNPLLAFFKAFVTAFVKFWSE